MALQSSGQISLSQVNTEAGDGSTDQISMTQAFAKLNNYPQSNGSNPLSMSELYDATASGGIAIQIFWKNTASNICSDNTPNDTVYYDPVNPPPFNFGDFLYIDAAMTTKYSTQQGNPIVYGVFRDLTTNYALNEYAVYQCNETSGIYARVKWCN